jgi:hypothetical protein
MCTVKNTARLAMTPGHPLQTQAGAGGCPTAPDRVGARDPQPVWSCRDHQLDRPVCVPQRIRQHLLHHPVRRPVLATHCNSSTARSGEERTRSCAAAVV